MLGLLKNYINLKFLIILLSNIYIQVKKIWVFGFSSSFFYKKNLVWVMFIKELSWPKMLIIMWDFNNNFILFFNTFTKWKSYGFETCIDLYYLMFNFIN
jgi:hypothetical protein